jgi:hypothetical protein
MRERRVHTNISLLLKIAENDGPRGVIHHTRSIFPPERVMTL